MNQNLYVQNQANFFKEFKILVLGLSNVGKTALIQTYISNQFDSSKHTINPMLSYINKIECINGNNIKLTIYDVPEYSRLINFYMSVFRNTSGIIICYDITDRFSFNNVQEQIKKIQKVEIDYTKIIKVLIATKQDLKEKRIISTKEGEELAQSLGMDFFEISIKDDINKQKIFRHILFQIMDRK